MDCSMPGFPVHRQFPELAQTPVHRVGDAIQPSHPLSSPSLLPSIFPCIRVFSNELVLHIRWLKNWSFSFSISFSSDYSGMISFTIHWLNLLAVQGTLKSLLQHHSSKVLPVQVRCMIQDARGWCTGMTQRDGMRREAGGGSGWGTHVHPWQIHVNVWQNQYSIVK